MSCCSHDSVRLGANTNVHPYSNSSSRVSGANCAAGWVGKRTYYGVPSGASEKESGAGKPRGFCRTDAFFCCPDGGKVRACCRLVIEIQSAREARFDRVEGEKRTVAVSESRAGAGRLAGTVQLQPQKKRGSSEDDPLFFRGRLVSRRCSDYSVSRRQEAGSNARCRSFRP